MAKRTIEQLLDDIDGSEATTSIEFAFEGTNYEIDLNEAHAEKFREAIKPWLEAARKASKSRASSRAPRSRNGKSDLASIREWAKSNGHKVSDRGRISADVTAAYEAAH